MLSLPLPQARQSTRVISKRRASLVINLDSNPKRFPCLILDFSQEGFRARGIFHLKCHQVVELILDEYPPICERCSVVWVGKPGSRHEGEVGLETI